MASRESLARKVSVWACGLIALVLLSGLASANTRVWTSQADFESGTLTNVDATGSPGNLTLSTNATAFIPYAGNPVFMTSSSGWDTSMAIVSTILSVSGGYVMWYSGSNGSFSGIGRATSTDGIHWTRSPTTPLIGSASWPYVRLESGTYKMWFEHTPGAYQRTSVYYATSTDGITWTMYSGNPVLAPSATGFDSFIVAPGGLIHDGAGYRLWFAGNDGISLTYSVGLATSPDGINWTRYGGNPIITPPFGGWWDEERVLPSVILPWNGNLLMGYVGADSSFVQRIALATSADGIHWAPYPRPTLDVGSPGSWDGTMLSHLEMFAVNGNLTIWYGGSSSGVFTTGLAKAPALGPEGFFDSAVVDSGANGTTWDSLWGNGTTPGPTSILLAVRAGDSAIPNGTWSGWRTVGLPGGGVSLPRTRYVQVRAILSTTNGTVTPVLNDVTLTYTPDRAASPDALSPSSGAWTSASNETFSWTFSDPDPGDIQVGYQLQVSADPPFSAILQDTATVASSAGLVSLPLPAADGTYYWRVRTEDNWGVWGPYTSPEVFHIDRTPPSVSLSLGTPLVTTGTVTYVTSETQFTLTATDGPNGSGVFATAYGIDNELPKLYEVPFRVNASDGLHILRFSAIDLLGNAEPLQTRSIYVDNTGPTSSIQLTATGDGYEIAASATDSGSGVASVFVSFDDGAWTSMNGAVFFNAAGNHAARAYAVDRLGNVGAVATASFSIPNFKPYVSGSIGILGVVLGFLLVRAPRRRGWPLGAAALALGGLQIAIASASAQTFVLAIPPWAGLSIALDGLLAAAILILSFVAWRLGRTPAQVPPPAPGRPLP